MSACVSVWQLNAPLLAVPEGYTKRLDTAFSVQNIVEELHYQSVLGGGCAHGAQRHVRPRGALRRAARRGRASDDYYLKRGGGGGAEGGGDGAE
jgi:hypothetical protein